METVQPAGQADSSNTFQRLESMLESAEAAVVPHIMSEQEIMHKYRKISTSVRIASRLFTSSLRLSNKILFTFKTLL